MRSRVIFHIGVFLATALIVSGGSPAAWGESSRERFFRAESAYKNLSKAPSRQKYRHHWLRVI